MTSGYVLPILLMA